MTHPPSSEPRVLAMKRADATIRRDVATRMRSTMNPVWRSDRQQARMLLGEPHQLIAPQAESLR